MIRLSAFALAILVFSHGALATLCGDDVDGADVPCACGDIVASDVVLDDDPVVSEVCRGDGLLIRAAGTAQITVDLAGKTLRGDGQGQGLTVVFGGERGARIVSSGGSATIEGFETGVAASGGVLSLIEDVNINDAVRDGLRARSAGLTVRRCRVTGAGRDGFALSGRDYLSVDNQSRANKRHGFMLMGRGGDLIRNRAESNDGSGFLVTGSEHEIRDCVASSSGKNGLEIVAGSVVVRGCTADGNGASGIEGHGAGWRLANNVANSNWEHGIDARGSAMIDEGGNRGAGNGGLLAGEVRQCVIGGSACTGDEAP